MSAAARPKRVDPFAAAAAKRGAAELVAGWPDSRLFADDASTNLSNSWGLVYNDARAIVSGERAKRQRPANDRA